LKILKGFSFVAVEGDIPTMVSNKHQKLVKNATALFSAIAASSFLGLPALAQANPEVYNRSQPVQGTTDANWISANCVPVGSPQAGMMQPGASMGATAPAGTPGVTTQTTDFNQQFPNQADPRTVAPSVGSMRGNEGNIPGTVQSGDMPHGDRVTGAITPEQTISTPVAPTGEYSSGGVGGPVGGTTMQQTTRDTARIYGTRAYGHSTYQNILGRGGATTGGRANQLVESANNPDRRSDEFANQVAYRTGDDWQQSMNDWYQTRNYGQAAPSIAQYGQPSGSQTLASCPAGMVPRQPVPGQQAPIDYSPDVRTNPEGQNVPGRALPNVIQTPDTNR
jgi:hypothetical protein